MKVVIDTNVFVSALIRPGDRFFSLADYLDRNATILYSTETLTELVDVLRRQKFVKYTTAKDVSALVTWVATHGELVADGPSIAISRDPDDDKFLALAIAGKADYLVTGDKDLLVLGKIEGIPILSPHDFLKAVRG